MALPLEYFQRLERELAEEKRSLKFWEEGKAAGTARIWSRTVAGEEDLTDDSIAHMKHTIAMYEEIIARSKDA